MRPPTDAARTCNTVSKKTYFYVFLIKIKTRIYDLHSPFPLLRSTFLSFLLPSILLCPYTRCVLPILFPVPFLSYFTFYILFLSVKGKS